MAYHLHVKTLTLRKWAYQCYPMMPQYAPPTVPRNLNEAQRDAMEFMSRLAKHLRRYPNEPKRYVVLDPRDVADGSRYILEYVPGEVSETK